MRGDPHPPGTFEEGVAGRLQADLEQVRVCMQPTEVECHLPQQPSGWRRAASSNVRDGWLHPGTHCCAGNVEDARAFHFVARWERHGRYLPLSAPPAATPQWQQQRCCGGLAADGD